MQFKAKFNKGKEITGYLKVAKRDEEDVLYVFYTDVGDCEIYDSRLQLVVRDYAHCENIEDFSEWAEEHDLEIVPRDPETYTDWKVGDRIESKIGEPTYTIIAKLGDVLFLSDNLARIFTVSIAHLIKTYRLILTDYEKELIPAQELEKKKECPFKEGDKVLVRDSDTSWKFDIFQNYEENACYSYECLGSEYEMCIPLNEHTWKLLGTTDEYKETNNNESH